MDYAVFTKLHSETIMYCQLIEGDLKWLCSFVGMGDVFATRNELDSLTLGQTVKQLKALDNSLSSPVLTSRDYDFLNQLVRKRNYWCHDCYLDFVYIRDWERSYEFDAVCKLLVEDHNDFAIVSANIENLKLKFQRG